MNIASVFSVTSVAKKTNPAASAFAAQPAGADECDKPLARPPDCS
jgi:hypothetical protein